MKFILLILLISMIHTDTANSQQSSLVKEDFVGDWQGKINGEKIEIAIWFTKRGMDSALGGYVILADSNCIQQFSYSEPSEHLWQYAKESTSTNALTKEEYFSSYQLSTRFPEWLDKHKNCNDSELIKNMSGIFSSYIFIKEYGETVQLAYTLLTDRENDNEIIKLKQEKNKKINKASRMKTMIDKRMRNREIGIVRRAIKNEASAVKIKKLELKLKKLQEEKSQLVEKSKTPVFIYKTQVYKSTLQRNVLSTLMLSLATKKRHYGSHPKPSKEEMIILQSVDG